MKSSINAITFYKSRQWGRWNAMPKKLPFYVGKKYEGISTYK